jgi:death on curing protein
VIHLDVDDLLHIADHAAARLHSVVRNHALVDGNKRLGLDAVIAFSGMNGLRLTLTEDEAYDLVMTVAAGDLDDTPSTARHLSRGTRQRA